MDFKVLHECIMAVSFLPALNIYLSLDVRSEAFQDPLLASGSNHRNLSKVSPVPSWPSPSAQVNWSRSEGCSARLHQEGGALPYSCFLF